MLSTSEFLSRFVAQAPNAMAMLDREMRYVAASPRWLSDYRLDQSPLGRSHYEVFPEIGDAWKAVHLRCLAGATEACEGEAFERADGGVQWVRWEVRPWTDPSEAIGGIVIATEDITARVEAQQKADELAQRLAMDLGEAQDREIATGRRLSEAIEVIPEGLLIYDADERLVVCNEAARAMHPRLAHALRPGVFSSEIVRADLDRHLGPVPADQEEEWIAERRERRHSPSGGVERRTAEGRWLRIDERRMSDGGFVALRTDITALKVREGELAQKTLFLETVLHSVAEGIAVFDGDGNLLLANALASQVMDAPAALFEPGSTLEAVVRFCAACGDFGDVGPDDAVRELIPWLSRQVPWTRSRRRRNGRVIDIRFAPMPDGGSVFAFHDITERADAEARLAERTAFLEATFQNMAEGIVVYDADIRGRISNSLAARLLAAPPALLEPGAPVEDLLRFRAERGDFGTVDVDEAVADRMKLLRSGKSWRVARRLPDGRTVDSWGDPLPGGGGVFLFRDITERAQAQARLAEKTALLEATLQNTGDAIAAFGPDLGLLVANDSARQLLGASVDLPAEQVTLPALARKRAEAGVHGEVDVDAYVALRVAQFQARTSARELQRLSDGRVFEALLTPLADGGGVYVFRDVTERADAEAKLREKNALLAAVRESSPEGLLAVGPARQILSYNERFLEMFGIPAEKVVGADGPQILDMVSQEALDPDAYRRGVEEIYRHGGDSRHEEIALVGGRVLDRIMSPLKDDDGAYLGRIWFFRDITERRTAEEALRASEERFRMLIEEAPDAILLHDVEQNRYVGVNRAAERLFAAPRRELLEKGPIPFYLPEQPDARPGSALYEERIRRALTGEEVHYARRIRRPSGEVRDCSVTIVGFRSPARLLRVSLVDVTEQNKAQRELASAAAILATEHESSLDGILIVDTKGRVLSVNRRLAETFGISPELTAARDYAVLWAAAMRVVAEPEAYERRVAYIYDHPEDSSRDELVLRDGRVIDRFTTPFKSSDGEILGRIGFFRDVTDRRRAEDALRASEERFRMLIEEAPDAILLWESDFDRPIVTNKAAERLFGISREEILAGNPTRFYAPSLPDGRTEAQAYTEHLERALAGEEVHFVRRIHRPSGEERVCQVTQVRLQSKSPLLRTSFVDVTEQALAEEEVAEVRRDMSVRQEGERQKIARELHDSLGQYLAAMNIKLALLAQKAADAASLKSGLAELGNLTSAVGSEVNRLAWELRPISLDDIGLEAAIRHLSEEWSQRSGLEFDLHVTLGGRRLPSDVESTLYRVLQEAITNVVKHARATRVGVILKASAHDVVLVVEDDGIGFDPEAVRSNPSRRFGLLGMRERLAVIHADLEIETSVGAGTTLIVRVAVNDQTATLPTTGAHAWAQSLLNGVKAERTDSRAATLARAIAERQEADAKLLRTTALLRAVGENSPDLIYAKDTSGRFLYANPAALEVIGRTPEIVLGHTDAEWHSDPKQAAAVMANDQRIMRGGVPEIVEETYDHRRMGTRTFRSAKAPFFLEDGTLAGIIGISSDITERKAVEAALRAAVAESDRANRAKAAFLAAASQDLRQPVQSLTLLLSVIRRQVAEQPETTETVLVAEAELNGLSGLLDGILDISSSTPAS